MNNCSVFYVPMLPIEARYTGMLLDIWEKQEGVTVISGYRHTAHVPLQGNFENPFSASAWALEQCFVINQMLQEIQTRKLSVDKFIFIFADIYHPAIRTIRWCEHTLPCSIRIGAMNNASYTDPYDMTRNMREEWASADELSVMAACDVIFAGSTAWQHRLQDSLPFLAEQIVCTGYPFSATWTYSASGVGEKVRKVPYANGDYWAWPHRVCQSKGWDELCYAAAHCPEENFLVLSGSENKVVGLPRNVKLENSLSKGDYLAILANAKGFLSTARQETWGYALHEALLFGVPVVVPFRASYASAEFDFLPVRYHSGQVLCSALRMPPKPCEVPAEYWAKLADVPARMISLVEATFD